MNQNEMEIEVNLLEVLNDLRKRVWIILAVTVLCAVLGLVGSLLFLAPQYTASTRIYVLNRANDSSVGTSDFQVSAYMVNDYQELIHGRNVTGAVIEQLGLELSNEALAARISVTSPSNTRFLQIDVVDSDPERAKEIANTVREVTSSQLKEIMKVDSVTTVYEAITPEGPSSPNVIKNTGLTGALGFLAVVAILVVRFIMDDRIRTEDDVERYLGLSVMGVIPDSEKLSDKSLEQKPFLAQRRGRR